MTTPAPSDPAQAEKKKTLYEIALTSTPVILTVVATFMVGQSSSEMTRAQYFRAVAGQNQSKVADQWAFFQAKRIRGTSYEVSADLLSALREPEPFDKEIMTETADLFIRELQILEKNAEAWMQRGHRFEEFQKSLKEIASEARRQTQLVKEVFQSSQDFSFYKGKIKVAVFTPERVKAALAALKGPEPPGSSSQDQKADSDLNRAIKAIKDRQSEKEIAKLVLKISDQELHEGIEKADKQAAEVYKKGKQVENVLEQLDKLVDAQVKLARDFVKVMRPMADPGNSAWQGCLERIQALASRLGVDYKTARHGFTARRYEDDARSNQESAYFYEVKAYLNGARSDRHLERSKNFLYAMLVAQVGVTIATLALAVKNKSLIWFLATLAGLASVGFGGYVFLGLE